MCDDEIRVTKKKMLVSHLADMHPRNDKNHAAKETNQGCSWPIFDCHHDSKRNKETMSLSLSCA